ncbi:Myeloid leukemia factor 1, partial [Fukomys damarensis]
DILWHTDVSLFQAMDRIMGHMQNCMQELQRNFVGDAHAFDDEWQSEILKYKQGRRWHNLENARMQSVGQENSETRELKRR